MDLGVGNSDKHKHEQGFEKERTAVDGGRRDGESNALLLAAQPKKQKSFRRKVQWNDRNGNSLVEVLEFDPSDSSDSDDDDRPDSCICAIM